MIQVLPNRPLDAVGRFEVGFWLLRFLLGSRILRLHPLLDDLLHLDPFVGSGNRPGLAGEIFRLEVRRARERIRVYRRRKLGICGAGLVLLCQIYVRAINLRGQLFWCSCVRDVLRQGLALNRGHALLQLLDLLDQTFALVLF